MFMLPLPHWENRDPSRLQRYSAPSRAAARRRGAHDLYARRGWALEKGHQERAAVV